MYQALLTRKYLTSKIMPLLAAAAVMLCAAMLLIVWSVMGGFLDNLVNSGRTVIGDVKITWPQAGFAHYEDLVTRLEADPMIGAACPVIETIGVVYLESGRQQQVQVRGVDGVRFARVTSYADAVWWKPIDKPMPKDKDKRDPRLLKEMYGRPTEWAQHHQNGLRLAEPGADGKLRSAVVPGIELIGAHFRQPEGFYVPGAPIKKKADGTEELIYELPWNGELTLHVVPLDSTGQVIDMVTRRFPVANEFRTGLYDIDNNVILVEFYALQKMLNMDEGKRLAGDGFDATRIYIDPDTGEEVFRQPDEFITDPARSTAVIVRAAEGDDDLIALGARVEQIYAEFAGEHSDVPTPDRISLMTWEQMNGTMIAAVKKETALVLFLFMMISLVSVFLVLAIFWSMVAEKTKDIGILRSLGASRSGVAWLWLRYGAAIGVVGAILGGVVAYAVVWNINPIHEWLGSAFGIYVWDPRVYYFTEIPNHVDPFHAALVVTGGILASVVGALIPAVRAARMNPVRALRFE